MKTNIIISIIVISTVILFWWSINYFSNKKEKTLTEKNQLLKEYREIKKSYQKTIDDTQKSIYSLDQKIIPLKCSIYSEVSAKEQWEMECSEFYNEQQSKIWSN